MAGLRHPHVVSLMATLQGPGQVGLVLQLCDGGSLRGALRRRGPPGADTAARWAADAARGMAYLHFMRVLHFDLKSDNLLLESASPQSKALRCAALAPAPALPPPALRCAALRCPTPAALLSCNARRWRRWQVLVSDFGLSRLRAASYVRAPTTVCACPRFRPALFHPAASPPGAPPAARAALG